MRVKNTREWNPSRAACEGSADMLKHKGRLSDPSIAMGIDRNELCYCLRRALLDAQEQTGTKALELEEGGHGGSGNGSKVWGPLGELATAFRPLLTSGLRRTTLLLLLIWFVNALCYYGLVLLTTSVRACDRLMLVLSE